MDLEVPEDHAALLRTMCGLGEYAELPKKIVDKYHEMKRICNRNQSGLTLTHLHVIAFTCGYGKPIERELKTDIVSLWMAGKVKRETPVFVEWKGGEKEGVLKRVDAKQRCIVQLDGDPDERPFEASKVRVAEAVGA